MRAVVLDLDQTLIRGEDADWTLWLSACEGALGVPVARTLDWASFPVHTDHGLLASLSLRLRGKTLEPGERQAFEQLVDQLLVRALEDEPKLFIPVDGAADFLSTMRERACIATGNLRASTRLKLRSAGLDRYGVPAACSEDADTRSGLVAHALRQVGWEPGTPATSFGDAVWDVQAARLLGIGFVGVAQSDAHEVKLRTAGARHVIRDFTDHETVIALARYADPPLGL
jgi:phosphoglycolate phosphatase-like HAD superfamily hydrolase